MKQDGLKSYIVNEGHDLRVHVAGRAVRPGAIIRMTPDQAKWELSRKVVSELSGDAVPASSEVKLPYGR